ncbi:MAG: hypothetical protein WC095_00835 [Candidatus Paceibacterota bacterium]
MEKEKVENLNDNISKTAPPVYSKQKLKALRTYQGDMQELISETNASVATIAIAEQKRKVEKNFKEEVQKYEVKNKFLVVLGITLFILGIITIGTVYFFQSRGTEVVSETDKTIVAFSEKKPIITNTRQSVVSEIGTQIKDWDMPANSVLFLDFTDSMENIIPSNVEKTIPLIGPTIPPNLLRSLKNDYMVGIYSFDKNVPFIILKSNDFGISFSGMLKWEETILKDLDFMFNLEGDTSEYTFQDESFKNKDLRIVKNKERQTVFLYSFLDRETILITSNEDAFNALLGKYVNSKMVR